MCLYRILCRELSICQFKYSPRGLTWPKHPKAVAAECVDPPSGIFHNAIRHPFDLCDMLYEFDRNLLHKLKYLIAMTAVSGHCRRS